MDGLREILFLTLNSKQEKYSKHFNIFISACTNKFIQKEKSVTEKKEIEIKEDMGKWETQV